MYTTRNSYIRFIPIDMLTKTIKITKQVKRKIRILVLYIYYILYVGLIYQKNVKT